VHAVGKAWAMARDVSCCNVGCVLLSIILAAIANGITATYVPDELIVNATWLSK